MSELTVDLLLWHSLAFGKYISRKRTDPNPQVTSNKQEVVQEADLNLFLRTVFLCQSPAFACGDRQAHVQEVQEEALSSS